MKTTPSLLLRVAVLSISSMAVVSIASSSFAAKAGAEQPAPQPTSDKAVKLPLEHAFVKETTGENKGLYTLTLKNTSAKALKVALAIEESVVSHNRPKNRTVSVTIEAGETSKNGAFAAHDKITVSADGFLPLTLVVP